MDCKTNVESYPRTQAVRSVLAAASDRGMIADLMFLEQWAAHPGHDLAGILRAGQIRRANPALADAIRQELSAGPS